MTGEKGGMTERDVGMNKLKSPAASFVKEGFIMPIAFYMDIKYFY
jgi:hypothetical protein